MAEGEANGAASVPPITVTMPAVWPWLFRIGTPVVGAALGLVARPVLDRVLDLVHAAPGVMRAAGSVPPVVAMVVLALVGLVAGVWIAREAVAESLHLTVNADGLTLGQDGAERYVARDRVAEVFLDGNDLVVLDAATRQVSRHHASDLDPEAIARALQAHGYPWQGTADPHEAQFTRWVEDHPGLDPAAHALLRARARALADGRTGAAADLGDELLAARYVVRDRAKAQEWRPLRPEVGSD